MKFNIIAAALAAFVISGCSTQSNVNYPPESMFSRLLVAQESSSEVKVITPRDNQITELALPTSGKNYLTTSGDQRFGIITQSDQNRVYFVDAAVENHLDHAHLKGEIHLAKAVSTGMKPAHLHTLNDRFVIFNDGNDENQYSSYTIGRERALNSSRPLIEKKASVNHHGAAVLFSNGNVVVTEKSDKAQGSLPDIVTLRDGDNKVLKRYKNIPQMHGNAGDGDFALLGSQGGVVVVSNQGDFSLIPAPENFDKERGNWFSRIMYGEKSEQFLAVAANHGVYLVDVDKKALKPLIVSKSIKRVSFDSDGKDLIVLEETDKGSMLGVFDIEKNKFTVKAPFILGNNNLASLAATKNYVYVALNDEGKVTQLRRSDLVAVNHFDVLPLKPTRMIFIGADLDEGHY